MMQSQAATEESPGRAFHCSCCTLIFKSKVYLFEHLNNVHGFDVDKALRESGLKQPSFNKASDSSCRHCDFTSSQRDILKEHEKQCPRNTEGKKGLGYVNISENLSTKLTVSSRNQHKEGAGTKDISSYFSVSATSKTKCLPSSSKDVKSYKQPSQTIISYFTGLSGTRGKSPVMSSDSPDSTKGTLILQESPSNSGGVFKVTAKSQAGVPKNVSDQDSSTDTSQNPKEELTVANSAVKRTINENTEDPPAKKAKPCKEETKPLMNGMRQAPSADFSFEISEDEDDESVHLVNGAAESPTLYFCKHCDYKDVSIRCVSNHYRNKHPYVRFNSDYIQDPGDQGATFRCLECPVEFSAVSELKRHYRETHPKAPDVITMQSRDLSLLYRCFVCQFTCKELKDLKEHYKENHPTHKADNPLLYCRYSVTRCQIASSRVETCKRTPEKSERNSPENTEASCKDVKSAASLQGVTSKPGDGATYKCNKCSFSHKSIIVIRVHYQKSHPDEPVSIDKIKQSRSASPMMPETSKCTPQKNTSESLSSMSLAQSPETKIHLKSPKIKEEHSAEDGSKARKSLDKHAGQVSSEMDSSTDRMFYCPFCSYSSNKVRSVLGHHSAKHTRNGPTSIEELMSYSAKMQGKKFQTREELSGGTPSSHSEIAKRIVSKKPLQFEEPDAAVASLKASNAYDFPKKLFYCQKCNFANPTLKGVLNHQNKLHKDLKSNMDAVLRHTALICNEIEESKSLPTELSCATRLPLPLLNEGDENVLFCHYCNYRHGSMEQMMKHCFNRHYGCGITQEHIRLHTSLVREKTQGLPQKMTKDSKHARLEDKPVHKKNSKKVVKASVSQMQRVLKCHRCSYVGQHLYVLRRHMWKVHRSNRSGPEILRMCYRLGHIQSGYHCDMCVFSQKNAQALYEHFQEQHPENKRSLEYISTRLYVGPDACSSKIKGKVKRTEGGSPSQTSVENEAKTYSCKACSFKGSSLSEITCHYRAVHPWSVKEDGSDPGAKIGRKRSANGELKDQNEILASFDAYQIPLEFDSSSHEVFTCSMCPASFSTQHSLSTHCGMKHQGPPKEKHEQKPIQINRRVHVFKCPHCSYINNNYQGVITHCQMKHPALDFSADSLYLDRSCLKTLGPSSSGESLKHRGYMCKTCQQVYATTEKLNKHRNKCHKTVNVLKPAPQTSPASKMKPTNAEGARESLSKSSFPRKKVYAVIRCQHCSYTCTTNIGLSRHLHVHHRDSSASKDFALFTYKCVLCSRVYCRKKRLANHYIKKHGKDAFLKYYKLAPQKSLAASADPSSKKPESTSEQHKSGTKTSEKILVYKCPACPYVNASFHGTLTHCQMKHPKLVVRADELQTQEVFANNMVKCTMGKGSNERGYMCNKCPQIHASMLKLKIHVMCCHDHPNHSNEAEEQPGQSSTDPVSDGDSVKNPETCRSSAPSLQTKLQYKCHMCMYVGSCRKYLYCHYKHTHKLDGLSTIKLLQKYNKRKSRLAAALLQDGAQMKCKKCLNLTFGSSQLLIEHYSTCHRKMDFTVVVKISQRSTGSYKCRHCKKVVHGIKNLLCHLDRHRARRMKKAKAAQDKFITSAAPEAKSNEQNELPVSESTASVQENLTPAEAFTLQSTSKCTDEEHPEAESRDHKQYCKLCRRSFMSIKGLRSHERSHAALAAIKNLDNLPSSALKQNINKHVLYKAGTIRPFLCTFCSYRTTVLGLWKSHVMKKHQDFLMEAEETDSQDQKIFTKQPPYLTAENNDHPEPDVEPEKTEKSLYLEPPDVQRQLNQYSLMSSKTTLQEPMSSENSQLHCEFCSFNTGHLSSIRRHYQNRHGKKIFRCKDCDFLTGVRKTLEKHLETGHSTLQSETTQHRSHHCPFCLYQTKNKNNMIDHIVLHREERVVPIELRRSKLSRYLQGIVFRCHKCTFTSGDAENLRLHMMRHDDIRPYKCRLCYFDCPQLSDLEAHLSDKHQVMRNHELVGHVSLDQLEALCKVPEEEDESLSNLEQDVETDELHTHCSDVLLETLAKNPSDHDVVEKTDHLHLENEQDPQQQAVLQTTNDEGTENTAVQFEDAPGQGKGRNMSLPLTKQEAAEWSSTEYDEKAPKAVQREVSEGGDVPHHMPVSDEKGCQREGRVETEHNRNTEAVEDRGNKLLNEQSNITASEGPVITGPNSAPDVKNQSSGAPGSPQGEQQSPTSTHGCAQPTISHEGDSGPSAASREEEVVSLTDGEMPVENVESSPLEFYKKAEELDRDEQKGGNKTIAEDKNPQQEQEAVASVKDTDPLQANRGAATVEPAQVLRRSLYTCRFCGRNLKSSQELTRHVMRHGM